MTVRELLCFRVAESHFALPLGDVAEVAQALPLHAIPFLAREQGGIVNLRGEPLPVVDAGFLLTGTPGSGSSHLLVLEGEPGRVGLAVSKISGIRRDLEDGRPCESPDPRVTPDLATWLPSDCGPIGVLDVKALLGAAARGVRPAAAEPGPPSRREGPCHDAF
ncbi:MAG: chemotaxis protein CheW [Myxococcota bacterium]